MKRLQHVNVVRLLEIVTADDDDDDLDDDDGREGGGIYMVFEFMDHDLTGLSENNKYGGGFPLPQIKCYMQQLLEGLFCVCFVLCRYTLPMSHIDLLQIVIATTFCIAI